MGAPWKCLDCDARWYAMGSPSGRCLDCQSENIDVDTDPVNVCKVCGVTLTSADTLPCDEELTCPIGAR